MKNYLTKFNNLSDYLNFRDGNDVPDLNISYVDSIGDTIFYNKGTLNKYKNITLTLLNPENIPNSLWMDDNDGRGEYFQTRITFANYQFYYKSNGYELLSDPIDNGAVKLYKDSDYTIEFIGVYMPEWGKCIHRFGHIDAEGSGNTYGLQFKIEGNILSFIKSKDGKTISGDQNHFISQLFLENNSIVDFRDLYVPFSSNYKYYDMFKGFDLPQGSTLLMPDFYIHNAKEEHYYSAYLAMFYSIPTNDFTVYIADKKAWNAEFNYMFSEAKFTTPPEIIVEMQLPNDNTFYNLFEHCENLTTPWIPDTTKLPGAIEFTNMYKDCYSLRDLSSYMIDTTDHVIADEIWDYIWYNDMFNLSNAPADGTTGLTKGLKIKTNRWDRITVNNMYKNQTNLTEIYLLGPNLANYATGGRGGERLNDSDNFQENGTVYVTDQTVDINTLNAKFGIPTTWTIQIYSEE